MNGRDEYKRLTGFKARGRARYRVLLAYGQDWVEHCGAMTEDAARAKRRKLPQWSADKVRIIDLEAQ